MSGYTRPHPLHRYTGKTAHRSSFDNLKKKGPTGTFPARSFVLQIAVSYFYFFVEIILRNRQAGKAFGKQNPVERTYGTGKRAVGRARYATMVPPASNPFFAV